MPRQRRQKIVRRITCARCNTQLADPERRVYSSWTKAYYCAQLDECARRHHGMLRRFFANVEKRDDGCWQWVGSLFPNGYGQFTTAAGQQYAHRFAYIYVGGGEIARGMQIDHLCRNRGCVNPNHLEVVTHRENTLRGDTVPGRNSRKTHCDHGHEFTEENTYLYGGHRHCRTCRRENVRTARTKKLRRVAT